jgi:prepilin-type N-terminal cleavage/methylation domain-containing protein
MSQSKLANIFRRGFTLIELLVVIAIIGILASIILASLSTAQAKGRDARRVSDIKEIQLALDLYYDANSSYPVNIYNNNGSAGPSVLVSAGYISAVPYDPKGTVACTDGSQSDCYSYVGLGSGASNPISYHLGASLEIANNSALSSDSDTCTGGTAGAACASPNGTDIHDGPVVTGSAGDFSGLSTAAGGTQCNTTVGTAAPSGTETCFDVTP